MESGIRSRRLRLAGLTALLLGSLGILAIVTRLRQDAATSAQPEPVPEPVEQYRGDDTLLSRLKQAPLPGNAGTAAAEDWPQWRGPRRDGLSRETPAMADWSADGPRRVWSVAGGAGHSGVAVSGDRVYTLVQSGDDEALICLSAADGKELWRHRWPGKFFDGYAGLGPHAAPTVADGRVYALGATGQFHCVDAATGAPLWRHDLPREFETPVPDYGYSGAPLVDGDRVVVLPGGVKGASVAAFDRKDGRLLWKALDDRSGYSSPVAATLGGRRQLVVVTGEAVVGMQPGDGALLWRQPWTTHRDCNIATPIVTGNYVFVSSGYGKGCALLEIAADASAARPVYEHNRMRNHFSTGVLDGDHLYAFDEDSLACMNLRTGKVLWKQRGFNKGSLLGVDGHLIVLGENGRLALVKADPAAYRERFACTVSKTRCWAAPSLARGKLYLRDQESVFCLDLEARK